MLILEVLLAFAAPYLLAWLSALLMQRAQFLPVTPDASSRDRNSQGRLSALQRRALLLYIAPELLFSVAATVIALAWQPDAGPNSAALRWGLGGMAFVRLGLSAPVFQDVLAGQIRTLTGPLRKIQVGQRRALATEDGPFVVLPVEHAIFDAYAAGVPATIVFAPNSKRVVAVLARETTEAAALTPATA
jgi:hypothetical protein